MAQDALLLLEDEQALALHPEGDGLVVFDGQTGEGAECCCGGVGACCQTPEAGRSWASVYALDNPKLVQCGPTRRVDLAFSGKITANLTDTANGQNQTQTVDVSHAFFWEVDENDPNCVVRWGEVGEQKRKWTDVRYAFTTKYKDVTITETKRRRFPEFPYGHADEEGGIGGLAMWPLFNVIPSIGLFNFGSVWDLAFHDVLTDLPLQADGTRYVAYDEQWRYLKLQAPFGWSTKPINEAAGAFTYNQPGRVAALNYASSVTCDGGAHNGTFSDRITSNGGGGGGSTTRTITWTVSLAWTTQRTPCGSSGAGWPGCEAFRAAFIAGDAAADIDGDGFVTGKDFDLVLAEHPECGGFADSGSIGALVNRLRAQRRPAVRGAASAAALLGIP